MNLEEMARQFRAAFRVQNHPSKRSLQISLIDEEYAEFREAARHWLKTGEGAAEVLKEAGDLVYETFQICANEGWSLLQALLRIHTVSYTSPSPRD